MAHASTWCLIQTASCWGSKAIGLGELNHASMVCFTELSHLFVGIKLENGFAVKEKSSTSFVFPIGSELVALSAEDCTDPILFDFGPGSDAYFVYTRGRAIPKTPRRR